MKRGIMFLVLVVLVASCALLPKFPSVCDTLTEKSYLCDVSRKYDVRLEDVGAGLIIANAIAIERKVYTREEAIRVMKEIRSLLADDLITYAAFKTGIYERMDRYPGLLQVATAYVSDLGALKQRMFPVDRKLLSEWLGQQIDLLGGGK